MDSNTYSHSFLPQYECDRIQRFMRDVAKTLKLSHYTFEINPDVADDETAIANIDIERQRHIATVALGADWMIRSDHVKINALIHEVLHVAHHDLTTIIYHVIPESGYVPQAAMDMIQEATRIESEKMVDHFAGVFDDWVQPMKRWKQLKKKYPEPKEK